VRGYNSGWPPLLSTQKIPRQRLVSQTAIQMRNSPAQSAFAQFAKCKVQTIIVEHLDGFVLENTLRLLLRLEICRVDGACDV
jgi:hypothetical protein